MVVPSRSASSKPPQAGRAPAFVWLVLTLSLCICLIAAHRHLSAKRSLRSTPPVCQAPSFFRPTAEARLSVGAAGLRVPAEPPRSVAPAAADVPQDAPLDRQRAPAAPPPDNAVRLAAAEQPVAADAADAPEVLKSVTRSLSRSLRSLLDSSPAPDNSQRYRIPVAGDVPPDSVQMSSSAGLVSLVARDAPLSEILSMLARTQGLNIVASKDTDVQVSMTLERVPLQNVLDSVLAVAGCTWYEQNGVIYVTPIAASAAVSPGIQGRRVEVFDLDYAGAEEVQQALTVMLSPVGKSFVAPADPADNRKTRETVVVEDLPAALERIRQYVEQVDRPPRQVLIEAHILQIDLSDDSRHGVNYKKLFQVLNRDVEVNMTGFANPSAPTALFLSLDGADVEGLIECLKNTTDAKTLASPKVVVVNEQLARIQIGEKLGFRVTTTTETSTLESVDFLDVGVVMEVTPRITRDNRVMLKVHPEVSNGIVNPDTGLPQEETTTVETNVMLEDGKGLVIGGLIQEKDSNVQSKLPYLGDLYLVGKLFQRRQVIKTRSELVIALIPRIAPYDCQYQQQEDTDVMRAQAPLLYGPLHRCPRSWEPQLPDAIRNPRLLRLPPVSDVSRPHRSGCQCGRCRG